MVGPSHPNDDGNGGVEWAEPMTTRTWTLERVLFAIAGTVTLASVALAVLVSPWFLLLTAFVGRQPVGVRRSRATAPPRWCCAASPRLRGCAR